MSIQAAISGILKRKETYQEMSDQELNAKRQTLSAFPQLEKALAAWVNQVAEIHGSDILLESITLTAEGEDYFCHEALSDNVLLEVRSSIEEESTKENEDDNDDDDSVMLPKVIVKSTAEKKTLIRELRSTLDLGQELDAQLDVLLSRNSRELEWKAQSTK
ncbi:hypothetical protein DFQ28_001485 [Apophysomyces sp. BC1034]|nr:hypothetical protein DFQ30_001917 [Apophysomyces sp. BC1015]KAG0190823.1 hypothetical protein DFQ28_001485 [Apophysomyces sp. BC1034]